MAKIHKYLLLFGKDRRKALRYLKQKRKAEKDIKEAEKLAYTQKQLVKVYNEIMDDIDEYKKKATIETIEKEKKIQEEREKLYEKLKLQLITDFSVGLENKND